LREILVVGVGGFLGAVTRYVVSGWVHRLAGSDFPWGTLAVNLCGCFAIGVLMALGEARLAVGPQARLFLGIGALGSLTTFSTFGYETVELLRRAEPGLALGNAAGNLLLGCAAVLAGRTLVRWLIG
jgi:fluoride exporter